jgi:curli production assembly/transport component CsgF
MKKFLTIIVVLLLGSHAHTKAQALLYRPVNPSFGGNTFNYQWMIGSAQAQDLTKDPAAAKAAAASSFRRQASSSLLDNFEQSITQQLLGRISRQILAKQFGEETLQEGDFKYGDFMVNIRNTADGIKVRIMDSNGGETTVTVPYF